MFRKKISTAIIIISFIMNFIPFSFASANYFEPAVITDYEYENNTVQIKGETLEGTEVLIYDNLRFIGLVDGERSLANDKVEFVYKTVNLLTEGKHSFRVLARNKTSMVLSVFSNEIKFNIAPKPVAGQTPAPTLIQPKEDAITAKVKPYITGLSVNNTKVNIYIDGILNGGSNRLTHDSGTANFAYKPYLNLNVGRHTVWAVAIDERGNVSKPSNILTFNIEEQLPAPVIKEESSLDGQVRISGVVKSGLTIKVFQDHKVIQTLKTGTSSTNVSGFVFNVNNNLNKGEHLFYVTAVDSRGKESKWSNIVYKKSLPSTVVNKETVKEEVEVLSAENSDFQKVKELLVFARLMDEKKPTQISQEDLTAVKDILNRKKELKLSDEEVISLEKILSTENIGDVDKKTDKDIKEILEQEKNAGNKDTGILNESKESQSKLRWNLVIFILFLIAVVAWIFWVNRELIKERREQNSENDKKNS
jgi:hypothetical protein